MDQISLSRGLGQELDGARRRITEMEGEAQASQLRYEEAEKEIKGKDGELRDKETEIGDLTARATSLADEGSEMGERAKGYMEECYYTYFFYENSGNRKKDSFARKSRT